MDSFNSIISFNSSRLYNIFNKENVKAIPRKIVNSSCRDKVAGIAVCFAIVAIPLYVYKKFGATKVNEVSPIIPPAHQITAIANNSLEIVVVASGNVNVASEKKTDDESNQKTEKEKATLDSSTRKKNKIVKEDKEKAEEEMKAKEKKLKKIKLKNQKINEACSSLSQQFYKIIEYLTFSPSPNTIIIDKDYDRGETILERLNNYVQEVNEAIDESGISESLKQSLYISVEEILSRHPTNCSIEHLRGMRRPRKKLKLDLVNVIESQDSEIRERLRQAKR